MAEYVETVRLDRAADMPGMTQGGNQFPTGAAAAAGAQTTVISPIAHTQPQNLSPGRRRKKRKWLAVLLFFVLFIPLVVVGGRLLFRTLRDTAQQSFGRFQAENNQPRAFLGVSEFSDLEEEGAPPPPKGAPPPPPGGALPPPPPGGAPQTEGKQTEGVLVEGTLPDSPAERAGLIDGDIITKFDGMVVNGEDAMRETLSATPIGKTVEVVFIRDGETKTAQLTTISSKDYDFNARMPKERGVLGIDDTTRVAVEGTKIHGVRLNEVYANRPADLAGLKEGDIVVEFDKKPVRTNEGFEILISRAKPASTVDVVVYRDGQRVTIPVKMGRRT